MDQAAVWDLSLTNWRQLQEQSLLTKARALHAAIVPLTSGTTPPGKPYGLTAAKAAALLDLIEDYEAVISQPIAARAGRKAKTSDLRPRVRAVDGLLAGMDDLVVQFRGTPAGNLFVEGYFNARRIGGAASGGEDENPAGPIPTPPPVHQIGARPVVGNSKESNGGAFPLAKFQSGCFSGPISTTNSPFAGRFFSSSSNAAGLPRRNSSNFFVSSRASTTGRAG